jgi:tRNA A-37 threonylcarbamoyl transferase component Bud32
LRRSGSRRAFLVGRALVDADVPVPRPVAWATVRRFGLRVADYLISEEIGGAGPLRRELEASRQDVARRREILQLLGGLAAGFHVNGFSHRDLKDTNVLVTDDGRVRLWAVDYDGVRRARWLTRRRVRKDFRPTLHSLRSHGWGDGADRAALCAAHDVLVPPRLRIGSLP